jgi:DNA-binding Lrp family transcriptional regulator
VKPNSKPKRILERRDDKTKPIAVVQDDILVVASACLKKSILFRGAALFACFSTVLSKANLCKECIEDLAMEFARLELPAEDRQAWEGFWRELYPRKQVGSILFHNPSVTYTRLYDLMGSEGFDALVHEFLVMKKYEIPLEFEDYLTFMHLRFPRFRVSLDDTELRIIDALMRMPNAKMKQIADSTGISEQWASQKVSELRKRGVLRKFNRIPFSKIGIRMFTMLIQISDPHQDVFSLLENCPFLYSFRKMQSGSWDAMATICIPSNSRSIRLMREGLHMMDEWGLQSDMWEIVSSGVTRSFDYYSPADGRWNIPWSFLQVQLTKIHRDGLGSAFPQIAEPASSTRVRLEELDMQILNQIRSGTTSIPRIRESLRVGQHRVADSVRKMRKEGLIQTQWEVHNIGLIEDVLITTSDQESAQAIAGWSQRFPRAIISYALDGQLILVLRLPSGGSYGVSACIADLPTATHVDLLSNRIYGGWGFPYKMWNDKIQQWSCPEERMREWLESLK